MRPVSLDPMPSMPSLVVVLSARARERYWWTRRRAPAAWVLGALGLLASLVLVPEPVRAHELGPFQVYGTFQRGGAFRLDVKIDEEHLGPSMLGGPARRTRYGSIAGLAGPTEQRFGRYLSDLADSLTVAFDGVAVSPTLEMDPDGGAAAAGGGPARATMRIEGWIPGGAHAFTFASSLPVKSYPLVLRCEDDESSIWRWVGGGETSPPFALASRVVPPPAGAVARRGFALGFAAVVPHGPELLLLVGALFLLARRWRPALLMLAVVTLGQAVGLMLAPRGDAAPSGERLEALLALAIAAVAAVSLVRRHAVASPAPGVPVPSAPPRRPWTPHLARRQVFAAGLGLAALLALGVLCGLTLAPAAAGLPSSPSSSSPPPSLPPPQLRAAAGGYALGAAIAELAVMVAAFILIGLPFHDQPWFRGRVVVPVGCLIAVVGLYWSLSGLL